jgi:uncharacterized membrane protein YfbV (UPF0208 family)
MWAVGERKKMEPQLCRNWTKDLMAIFIFVHIVILNDFRKKWKSPVVIDTIAVQMALCGNIMTTFFVQIITLELEEFNRIGEKEAAFHFCKILLWKRSKCNTFSS